MHAVGAMPWRGLLDEIASLQFTQEFLSVMVLKLSSVSLHCEILIWDYFGMTPDDFGKTLGKLLEDSERTLERLWEHFKMTLGTQWENSGENLGRLWENSGKTLGRLWEDSGKTLDRFREDLGITRGLLWEDLRSHLLTTSGLVEDFKTFGTFKEWLE